MAPIYKRKRFWILMVLLGLGIMVVAFVALRKMKGGEMPVALVPPNTTAKANNIGASDGVVFRPLGLDMIKDSPSMAIMFLLEKVYTDDTPPVPLPPKQLLQSFFNFEYKRYSRDVTIYDFIHQFYITVMNFLLEERDLKDLLDELKNKAKLTVIGLDYFIIKTPDVVPWDEARHFLTFFKDLALFDPKIENEKMGSTESNREHYPTILGLIKVLREYNECYEEGKGRFKLECFLNENALKVLDFVRLPSQRSLLAEMCGTSFDGLSPNNFQIFFMDFVYRPRAGPWVVNNMRMISIHQAGLFAPWAKKYQLFCKSDLASMAAIQVDDIRLSSSIELGSNSNILNSLYRHFSIEPNIYFYYYLSESLKNVEFPETIDFDLGDFILSTKVCSLTQVSYPNLYFDIAIDNVSNILTSEDENSTRLSWKMINIGPFEDYEYIYHSHFSFSFDPSELDHITHRFLLEELNELREAYYKFPTRIFTEAQKQNLIEIYNASKFLLDQANYKPDFDDLGDLKNWPLLAGN